MKTRSSTLTLLLVVFALSQVASPVDAMAGSIRITLSPARSTRRTSKVVRQVRTCTRPTTCVVRSRPVAACTRVTTVRPVCPGPGYTWISGYWDCYGMWISGYWRLVLTPSICRVSTTRHLPARRATVTAHRKAVATVRQKPVTTRMKGVVRGGNTRGLICKR